MMRAQTDGRITLRISKRQKKGRGHVMTDSRGHNIKKRRRKRGKGKLLEEKENIP